MSMSAKEISWMARLFDSKVAGKPQRLFISSASCVISCSSLSRAKVRTECGDGLTYGPCVCGEVSMSVGGGGGREEQQTTPAVPEAVMHQLTVEKYLEAHRFTLPWPLGRCWLRGRRCLGGSSLLLGLGL